MKKAAIYMRVSTARQEEEETIQNQKMEILKRIEEDGNLLLPECEYADDGWSGAIIERPDLDRMRSDARENKFEVLYSYDRGRISRKFVHQEIILEELKECGIEYISLHDINGQTVEEQLMGSVMGIFHEYERVKITERMRIGKIRKVKENKKLLGYQPKYGLNYIPRIKTGPNARDGSFEINEKHAEVVRMIFEWASLGMSKYTIRDELFERGIAPPRGKSKQWSLGTIDRMLTDTTYIGDHFYNKSESVPTRNPQKPNEKYRKVIKGSRVRRPKEEWMKVKVPAIIDRKLFDKVQIQLARNKRTNTRNNKKNRYLVSGVIECACGYARAGEPAKTSLYYRCTDRLNNVKGTRKCTKPGINATVLDSVVWNNIQELLTQPDLVRQQAERWQNDTSPLENRLNILKVTLKSLEEKEARYATAYGQGDHVMTLQIYQDNMHELNEKRAKLLSEISGLEDEMANKPTLPLEKIVDGVIKLVKELDFINKKEVIQKIVTKIIATKEEITIWGHIPVPVLATEQVWLNAKYRHSWPAKRR